MVCCYFVEKFSNTYVIVSKILRNIIKFSRFSRMRFKSYVKLTQPAVDKRLKAIAATARNTCSEVPVRLHAHQFRHAKATHWLEDGINIVQISFLLGHENVETTMKYLDITLDSERKALQTLETESERKIKPKWKSANKSLKSFCGI